MKRREVILVLLVGVGRVFGTDRAAARLLAQPCKVVRIRILGGLGRRRSTRSSATGGGHRRGCCPGRGRSTRSSASGDSHGCATGRIAKSIASGYSGGYGDGRTTRSATGGGHRRGCCPGRGRSTRSSATGGGHGRGSGRSGGTCWRRLSRRHFYMYKEFYPVTSNAHESRQNRKVKDMMDCGSLISARFRGGS